MLFVIMCRDKPGISTIRATSMDAHRNFVGQQKTVKVVISGPLVTDDGARITGSLFIVEAERRSEVERFQKLDPLFQAGIWQSIEVHAFSKRVDNRNLS